MNYREYWNNNYRVGNSGRGSYGSHAVFKAEVINNIITKYNIKSILDFGCGDGNQISFIEVDQYVGLDISDVAIDKCTKMYENDMKKKFQVYSDDNKETAEMTMSLDVIYHLVDDIVFENYLSKLFDASEKYILIYSSDFDSLSWEEHVRHRKITNKISEKLIYKVDNIFPDCPANFYLYSKE